MNNNNYLLIIGGEVALRERSLLAGLRSTGGAPIYTVASNICSPGLRYFDGYIHADIADHVNILDKVIELEKKSGATPIAVIPTNDFTVKAASVIADHYKLNANSLDVVELCRDKYLMKEKLNEAGLDVPKYIPFSTYDELLPYLNEIRFPVVIKPRQMGGSLGVIKVENIESLKKAYEDSLKDVLSLGGVANSKNDVFLLEEYIDYPDEVSVEVINFNGVNRVIAVTDKYLGEEPYFVELGHVVPSRHSHNKKLIQAAEKACKVLGIRFGMAHFEAKVNNNGDFKIIEVGARTGGDSIMDLVECVYGVNPYQLHIQSYLGTLTDINIPEKPKGIAAIAFLHPREGEIKGINTNISFPDFVKSLLVTTSIGKKVKSLTSWNDRAGFVQFFWENRQPEEKFHEHITIANEYTNKIFTIEDEE